MAEVLSAFMGCFCCFVVSDHYSAFIYGAGLTFTEKEDDGRLRPAVELQFQREEQDDTARQRDELGEKGADQIPHVQAWNEHNGNEARQSYHGLPRDTVQPIRSPQRFVMNPMQINTKNPNGPGRGGPLPKESQVRCS